jgi:O-antigen/teichoic acid export membrane protein
MSAAITVPHLVRLVLVALGARRLGRMRPRFHMAEAWDLLRESMPLTLLIVVAVLYWNADGFLLTLLAPVEQIAAYGVSLQIAFALTVVGQVFGRATLSTINAAFRQDPARFRAAVDRAYRFLLLCAAPVAVLGWPLAPRIVEVVAGPAFTPVAGPVLRVFFVAVALMFLTAVSTDVLIAAEEQRFLWRLSTANLGGNVALNLVLIPLLGAVGAGIALITSELSGVVFAHRRIRRHGAPAFPFDQLLRLAPGLALALVGMWLTWSLPLAAALTAGTVGYVAGALAGRAVPRDMIDTLLAAFRRVPRASGVGR